MSNFDFGSINFNLSLDIDGSKKKKDAFEFDSRYVCPAETPEQDESFIKYENAEELANKIDFKKRTMVIVNGSFVLGDFIEAVVVKYNMHIKRMIVSTLSLNEGNVDSLKNLLEGGYVDRLDLIISDYFFKTEQDGHGNSLVPYIYKQLDYKDKFQLCVSRSHTKITMFETHHGQKLVLHGSANYRSSANLENLMIENSHQLYDFLEKEIYNHIIEKYFTIVKNEVKDGKHQKCKE